MPALLSGDGPLARTLTRHVLSRSLAVAAVVGTILNAINQGDALVAGRPLDWLKIALTFCVPFCVATYGAYTANCVIARGR